MRPEVSLPKTRMKRFPFPIRLTAVLVLLCFTTTDLLWAQGQIPVGGGAGPSNPVPARFLTSGRVESVSIQNHPTSATLIYHIQDAHGVYEAQANLAKILEELVRKEGISLVLVEGGSGNVGLEALRKIAWKGVRHRVAEEFLREGKISGEEYLQLATNYRIELLGIEDPVLYRENVETFLRAMRRKEALGRALSQIASLIRSLERLYFGPDFRRLLMLKESSERGERGLMEYLSALKTLLPQKGIPSADYPQWSKLEALEKGGPSESFDHKVFFKELSAIEEKIREKFLTRKEEKLLFEIREAYLLARRLFSLELTSTDYDEIRKNPARIDLKELTRKLKLLQGKHSFQDFTDQAGLLEKEKPVFLRFYELARRRDQVFLERIRLTLQEKHPKKLVLITGGFHSERIGKLLQRERISRILVSSEITKLDPKTPENYQRILREKIKSALRAPATYGTPYFSELRTTLEREQTKELHTHIKHLIGFLDVDEFLPDKSKPQEAQSISKRSELRVELVPQVLGAFANFSDIGARALWTVLLGAGLAGVAWLSFFLWKRFWKPGISPPRETEAQAEQGGFEDQAVMRFEAPRGSEIEGQDPAGEGIVIGIPEDGSFAQETMSIRQSPEDLAKALARETRRFFDSPLSFIPDTRDLPPPPYELPLPAAYDAIPANLDRRGKTVHMLRQLLEAMEAMDQAVITRQKEASERSLERALEKGTGQNLAQNYLRFLKEDFKRFIEGTLQEMKNLPETPQAILNQPVSEEIEERHPRLPRAVKVLLSEDPALLEDREIGELTTRITRKMAPRPPVAPDIDRFVEDAFHRLNGTKPSPPEKRRKPAKTSEEKSEAIQVTPPAGILPRDSGEKADEIQPQEETPRPRPPSAEMLRARISDLRRQLERFETDRGRLAAEITKVEREYRELIEALNQAVDTEDTIVQEALRPAVESYETRLERLRANQGELGNRITRVREEEGRLHAALERAELDEEREGGGRSELRGNFGLALLPSLLASFSGFSKLFLFVGLGALVVGSVIYLVKLTGSLLRTRSLLDSQKQDEPLFDRKRIFNETVPDKPEDPKIDFFKDKEGDLSGLFIGLGVFLGWVIGGIALYQAYHSWEWETSKQFFSLGENPKGEKQYFTFGGLLWILEIFVAPIIGGILGAIFAFLLETSLNAGRRLVRRLRFPLDYERALRFYVKPFESLDSQTTRGALRLFARMEKPTLEVILQKWITQGEHEKIKFFADHAAPEPDKSKAGSQPKQSSLPFRESEKAKIIRVYDDVAGFERLKKMLTAHTEDERRKNEILEILQGWRTALDRKNLNGAKLLKDLIPELAKGERYFSKVRAWTETLLHDPDTPWGSGSPEVKKYYEALRALEEVKGKAGTQFSLTPTESRLLKDHLAEWKERIPGQENKVLAVALLGALLTKAIQSSPDKESFLRALKLVNLIPESFFRTASKDRLLRRFDETRAYNEKKERLRAGLPPSRKEAFEASILTLEASLKAKNLDPLTLLPEVFGKLEKKTPEERVALLEGFVRLSPEIYRDGSQGIQKVFEAWVTKEEARERLARQGEQVRKATDEIEAKVSYRSLLEILSLSLIYLNLELKAKPEARGPFLAFLAGVPDSVFGVFLSSHETLLKFYLARHTERDFRNLGELLARYRARYGEIQVLTESLLEILTDRAKNPAQRMEEARQAISQQILLKYGYPQKVTEVWDAVSPEELLRSVGESVLRQRTGNSVVKSVIEKVGRYGLQSYWEEAKPSYYTQFLKETEGIPPEFFRPGEKFRVAYDREGTRPKKLGTLSPIEDPVRTLRELVRNLRFSHPRLYDNFISPKRELLNGRPLEDVIDERSLVPVAKQFLAKARDWPISESEKIELLIRTSEVLFFKETRLLLGMRSDREEAKYWEEWLRLFGERGGFKKDSELYRSLISQVRKQIAELTEASQAGREGIVQFILTRGGLSDFFRGEVSEDCCSEARNLHFTDTVGLPTDPAFLAFELVENGHWIGNIYSIVLKDSEGKFIFYLDNMPIRMSHPLAAKAGEFDPERRNLMKGFFERLKELLSENGFESIALAPDPSSREQIKSAIRQVLTEEKAVSRSEKTTKPGGFGHQSEFSVSSEYIQGLGTLSSSISANGSWISLESKGVIRKRKEREIQEIQRSLDAAQREKARLERIEEEKARKLKHLQERGQEAQAKETVAVAQVLQAATRKEALEADKVSLELQEMEGQISGLRERLSQMEKELSRSELRTKETGTATLFSSLGAAFLAFQHDPFTTLFFVAVAGLVFWLIWILIRGEREEPHWTERRFWLDERTPERSPNLPPPPRELWRENPLVLEVVKLFRTIFQKMSAEMRPFIPPRIFVPVGVHTGFELSKRVVTALSTARLVLVTLQERSSLLPFLKEQKYYEEFKKRTHELGLPIDFDQPDGQVSFEIETRGGRKIPFSLELSDRSPDDILRGDVSRDCTALGGCSAFYETTPRFLLDPGFLNFKLRMEGAWVGNIYALVAERKGSPVLIVDALQLSPWAVAWPVRSQWIAERALSEIVAWGQKRNFQSVLMSRFISNFFHLYDYFDPRYPPKVMEIEKLGGFEHLKALGLWDEENPRNEYLETFSPHWNQPLKEIDPNLPKQKILLRAVWTSEKEGPSARSEVRAEAGSLGGVVIEGYKFHFYQNEWVTEGPNPDQGAIRLALTSHVQEAREDRLGMATAFERDGLKNYPIRVRVHTEEGKSRIYKFIAEIPEGKRNYVLEMTPVDDTFTRFKARFRAYTEELNHIENALLTARDGEGRTVGLRNIFSQHGEPPGPENHLIPLYGRLFVEQASSDLPEGTEIKVVDLKIDGKSEPSLRTVLLKKDQSTGRKLENPKALYAYTWGGEEYVFGIYPPKAPVRLLAAEPPEPQKKAPIVEEPSFEEPIESPLPPRPIQEERSPKEEDTKAKPEGDRVGEQREVPDSDVRAQSAPPEKGLEKTVEVPEPSAAAQTKPTSQAPPESVAEGVSKVASGLALAGAVGLGQALTGPASRLGTRARERKLREKAESTKAKIAGYQKQIEEKKNEVLQEIDAVGLESSPPELLGKLQALKERFVQAFPEEEAFLEKELNQYQALPAYAQALQELQGLYVKAREELSQTIKTVDEKIKSKLREKLEASKEKIKRLAEDLVPEAKRIDLAMRGVPVDLSPAEVDRKTQALQDELLQLAAGHQRGIEEIVESFHFPELSWAYEEILSFAKEAAGEAGRALDAMASPKEELGEPPEALPSDEAILVTGEEGEGAPQPLETPPVEEAAPPGVRIKEGSRAIPKEEKETRPEIEELKTKLAQQENELKSKDQMIDGLRESLDHALADGGQAKEENALLHKRIEELEKALKERDDLVNELRETHQRLKDATGQRIRELEDELDRARQGEPQRIQELTRELEKAREERQAFEESSRRLLERALEQIRILRTRIRRLIQRIREINREHARALEGSQAEVERLTHLNQELQAALEAKDTEMGELRREISRLEALRIEMERTITRLRDERDQALAHAGALEGENMRLHSENATLKKAGEDKDRLIEELRQSYKVLEEETNREIETLKKELAGEKKDKSDLEKRIRDLEKAKSDIEQALQKLRDETIRETARLRARLRSRTETIQRLTRELEEAVRRGGSQDAKIQELTLNLETLTDEVKELQGKIKILEDENKDLKSTIERLGQGESEQIKALRDENSRLSKELMEAKETIQKIQEASKEEITRLAKLLKRVEAKARGRGDTARRLLREVEDLKTQLEHFKAGRESLSEVTEGLERQKSLLAQKDRELEEKERQITEKDKILKAKEEELSAKDKQLQDLNRVLQKLEEGVQAKTGSREKLDQEIKAKEGVLQELERAHSALQKKVDEINQRKEALEKSLKDYDSLQAELVQARKELSETQTLRDKAKEEYEKYAAQGTEAKSKLEALKTQIDEREKQVRELENKISDLETKEKERRKLLEEITRFEKEVEAKGEELRGIEGKIAAVKTELADLEKQKETLQREIANQREELVGIEAQKAQTQRQYDEVLKQVARERERRKQIRRGIRQDLKRLREIRGKAGQAQEERKRLEGEMRQKDELLQEKDQAIQTKDQALQGKDLQITSLSQELAVKKSELTQTQQREQAEKERTDRLDQQHRAAIAQLTLERDQAQRESDQIPTSRAQSDMVRQSLALLSGKLTSVLADLEAREKELKDENQRREGLETAVEDLKADRDTTKAQKETLESDLVHLKEENATLEEALREARRTATAQVAAVSPEALDGRESLEALLSELPENLWALLGEHFPGQRRARFQLTVDSVTQELVEAWNRSPFFRRIVKNLILYRSLYRWLGKQPFYREFKNQAEKLGLTPDFDKPGEGVRFKVPGDERTYSLELSKRDTEYLLRGFFSGDCTNCGPGYVTGSFLTATGSHIVDPGFFNFKILREGEWVGNVYGMAIEEKGKPVLVIDAIQIPWQQASPLFIPFDLSQSNFPIGTEKDAVTLAEGVIGALGEYSKKVGYQELWLSSFVSNFSALKTYFYGRQQNAFDRQVTAKAKIGGWNALQALGYEGHPYVESIGHPEAKKVWPLKDERPAVKTVEAPPPKEKPAPPAKREAAAVAVPETPVQKEQAVTIERRDMTSLMDRVKEGVDFASKGILMREMEFIVQAQETPLRWVAFDDQALEWRVYEKSAHALKTYPLFERGTGVRQKAGTLNLSQVEIEVQGSGKVPLPLFLKLPPLAPGLLETYLEDGGALLLEEGRIKLVPFLKKGFIGERFRGAFFVHPGDERLEEKSNITLPLSNHYEWLRRKFPKAWFLLGWHTNPGGEPSLHKDEEAEIMKAGAEGFQLVTSPKGVSLIRYYRIGDRWKRNPVFSRGIRENWATELEKALSEFLGQRPGTSASGYQLGEGERALLEEAIERGEKTPPRNAKPQIQKLLFDLNTAYGLEPASLESFIENSDFQLVILKPRRVARDRAPPMGLGVDLGRPGRDVYATFEMEPKEEGNGFIVTFYVGQGIYELAGEKEKLEILAHELYQAYRQAHNQNPQAYPFDIDLEVKIDEEIRLSDAWEGRIPREEREDLGLVGGTRNRTNPHVRSRAFARLLGSRSPSGIGTTYTDLLRRAYALEKRFGEEKPVAEDPLSMIPPLEGDSFRYTEDSFDEIVSPEDLQTLFEMSAYIHEHKEEDLLSFLEKKIEEGRRLLVLNTNAPTPWILKDIRKITEDLASEGNLSQIFLDLPPALQPLIDSYLSTGRSSEELAEGIRSRFPEFLPKEFQRPDLYENILRAVYEHNLEAREGRKISVVAYYEPRRLPPMPQGRNLPFPGRGEFPFEPGAMPFQPPFPPEIEGARPPVMPRPGELPFPPGNLPALPLSPGVEKSLRRALSEIQKGGNRVILFVKPLDEFLPDPFRSNSHIASILHLDRYTGFGPKKPENKLALYISEQASPNQKSFALPVLREAPFYEESINPGLPKGIPFNEFSAYPDLILSTSGEGDETSELTPDEAAPETIEPLVPVGTGPRSELRILQSPVFLASQKLDKKILGERDAAVRELARIGEPAVLPLIETLTAPSLTARLGAIQALGLIGDPRAIAPLSGLAGALELREAARVAIHSIREREIKRPRPASREKHGPARSEEARSVKTPSPDLLYTSFRGLERNDLTQNSLDFIREILRQTTLVVELDAETLLRKDGGRLSVSGWGFIETLKTLEARLPGELLDRIRIRIINLNPSLHDREIAQAFQITPEIQGMIEIRTVPVRHHAFRDLGLYLMKDSLKIASERHQDLWQEKIDILVREPGKDELIDGRKLFLAALLHRTLRKKIPQGLRLAAERLLREIGSFPVKGLSQFAAQNRSTLSIEFLSELERINRLLSTMA